MRRLTYKSPRQHGDKEGDYMNNDEEGLFGLLLFLIIGYLYRVVEGFRFVRSFLTRLVMGRHSTRKPVRPVHCEGVERSEIAVESSR